MQAVHTALLQPFQTVVAVADDRIGFELAAVILHDDLSLIHI